MRMGVRRTFLLQLRHRCRSTISVLYSPVNWKLHTLRRDRQLAGRRAVRPYRMPSLRSSLSVASRFDSRSKSKVGLSGSISPTGVM